MFRTLLAVLILCLTSHGRVSAQDDLCRYTANCDYEIRERLLSIPYWIFEVQRAGRMVVSGQTRCEKRGYKLFALTDTGLKCEAEVTFVEGGFTTDCTDPRSKKYVQVDDAYQSIFGSYILTLRPPQ